MQREIKSSLSKWHVMLSSLAEIFSKATLTEFTRLDRDANVGFVSTKYCREQGECTVMKATQLDSPSPFSRINAYL